MKKRIRIIIIIGILLLGLTQISLIMKGINVQAEEAVNITKHDLIKKVEAKTDKSVYKKTSLEGSVTLKAGTTYTYDLNGDGKEEKIKYSVNQDSFPVTVKLYIDGKKKLTKEGDGFTFYASLSNIDKSDKYLEISIIGYGGDNYMSSLNIYQYTKSTKKITELFQYPTAKDIYYLDYAGKLETSGDGTFTWPMGGVVGLYDFCELREVYEGAYGLGGSKNIKFILKNGKIKLKSKEFTATGDTFTTLKDIVLLDKASTKGKKTITIKSGSSVIITKIKYIKKSEAFLYVRYGKKKGWCHIKNDSGVVFRK